VMQTLDSSYTQLSGMRWVRVPTPRCTTQITKGFEIEFRVLLGKGTQQVRFERVAVFSLTII
jgi:hypothetical protein